MNFGRFRFIISYWLYGLWGILIIFYYGGQWRRLRPRVVSKVRVMEIEILTSSEDLESYQAALYERFEGNYDEEILKVFYELLPRQLVPRLERAECLYYGCKEGGQVVAGMAANEGPRFLLEGFGFKVEERAHACEGFALFGLDSLKDNFFDYLYRLGRYCLWDLHERGYKTLYYSSTKRLEAMYTFMGCEEVDSLIYRGEKISLMRLEIVKCLKDKGEIFPF